MHRWIVPLALLAAAPCSSAQDAPNAAARAFASLDADYTLAVREFNLARRALEKTDEYQAAVNARDRARLAEISKQLTPLDSKPFVDRSVADAEEFAGTDGAIPFLAFVVKNAGREREAMDQAVATLIEHHADSAAMLELAEDRQIMLAAPELRDRLAESSPHQPVRAAALYWRGLYGARGRDVTDEQKAQAAKDLEHARELAAEGSELAAAIAAPEFEKEHLQVGMVAPDIEGEDMDGVPFKLSDYRGKVVVIDFWGDW